MEGNPFRERVKENCRRGRGKSRGAEAARQETRPGQPQPIPVADTVVGNRLQQGERQRKQGGGFRGQNRRDRRHG